MRATPSSAIVRPTIDGSAPKRRRHRPGAEDRDGVVSVEFFLREKRAADRRLHAEHVEEVRRDQQALHPFGIAGRPSSANVEIHGSRAAPKYAAICSNDRFSRRQSATLAGAHSASVQSRSGIGLPELYQASGIGVRQGPPQDGVDDAEDGGGGADAKGQGDRGDEGETRVSAQHARAVAEVLREEVEAPVLGEEAGGMRHGADAPADRLAGFVPELAVPLTAPVRAPPFRHDQAADRDDGRGEGAQRAAARAGVVVHFITLGREAAGARGPGRGRRAPAP